MRRDRKKPVAKRVLNWLDRATDGEHVSRMGRGLAILFVVCVLMICVITVAGVVYEAFMDAPSAAIVATSVSAFLLVLCYAIGYADRELWEGELW